MIHRLDQPIASGPTCDTADEVRTHLDEIAKLPCWRLDLDDESIEFDNVELTITDTRTRESFCLKGWKSLGISGVPTGDQRAGAYEGARHLSVCGDHPPMIGKWHKSDKA